MDLLRERPSSEQQQYREFVYLKDKQVFRYLTSSGTYVIIASGQGGGSIISGNYQPSSPILSGIANLPSNSGCLTNDGYGNFSYIPSGGITPSGGGLIGQRTIGVDAANTHDANYVIATKFMAFDTFIPTKMSIMMYSWTNGAKGKLAIYSDYAGSSRPTDAPLAQTAEFISTGGNDISYIANLTSFPNLTIGTYYWLAFLSDTAADVYQVHASQTASKSQEWSVSYINGFPTISTVGDPYYGEVISAFAVGV